MAFDPLPAPSTFANAILAIENQLAALDARLATLTFSAQSADHNVTIVVDASIEVVSVTILPPLLTAPVNLTTLASTLVTVVNQALAAAHTRAASEAATAAAAFNLQGVCAPNAAMPNYAGFAQAAASLTAQEPAVDARVAALQFPGQVGVASAVASGHLDVVSLTIARLPDYLPTLSSDVGNAINQALGSAKKLVDTTIGGSVDTLPGNVVKITDLRAAPSRPWPTPAVASRTSATTRKWATSGAARRSCWPTARKSTGSSRRPRHSRRAPPT
jgi:DNA-binding protein YbaB